MKSYYLRFTTSDFTKSGKIWYTSVYDLYDNSQYKNYSVKRSTFGTNLLGDGTYTGLNKISATQSEIGYVSSGRFIDTSGRINIVNWGLQFTDDPSTTVSAQLAVYNTNNLGATPGLSVGDEWLSVTGLSPGDPIYLMQANRYAFFQLTFATELASISTMNIELLVQIEIDPPVVNGYFTSTHKLQNTFPEWMKLREYDPTDPFGATPATPNSVGGQLINAIAGEWLDDVSKMIQYQQYQNYIDTVDLGQKAWIYVTHAVPMHVRQVTGDGTVLARASDMNEFHETLITSDCYFLNSDTSDLFTNKKYGTLLINGVQYVQEPYHIWNSVDDIGLSVDLLRIQSATPGGYLEDNDSFRKRILDVYQNKPGVSEEAFKKTLRREFNLWKYSGATPDSTYLGATPEVLEISDFEKDTTYFGLDGIPTQKFKDLVDELAEKYPLTWGFFKYQNAFWDPDGIAHQGFKTLPRQLDATPLSVAYRESGVGDGNDLYMFKPDTFTGAIPFSSNLRVRGRQRTTRSEYMPLTFDVKVYGRAAQYQYNNPTLTGYFTIELVYVDPSAAAASPNATYYYCLVTVNDTNRTTYLDATPTTNGRLIDWTTPDGYTDIGFRFKNKITGQEYPGQINLANVSQVSIIPGHFNGNFATPGYERVPNQTDYKAWFASTPGTIMGAGGGTSLSNNSFAVGIDDGSFYFASQLVNFIGATPGTWISDVYYTTIKLNGVMPNMTQQNYTYTIPNIVWPTDTTTRELVIELVTNNGSGTYGAMSDFAAATPIFLPSTYIQVNGDSTWTAQKKVFAYNTTSVIFSSASGSLYPFTANVWSPFTSSITYTASGTVDEFGPWRNSQSLAIGNTDFTLTPLSLNRDNFSIPNTTDYIITWIGVETVSDDRVMSWLDTNNIIPAVVDPGELGTVVYPTGSITETFNSTTGKYEFSQFKVYAKIKSGVNEQWNPKLHSGWFTDDLQEYYLYANPVRETTTASSKILIGPNRLGAPVLVKALPANGSDASPAFDMRHVAVFDDSATPTLGFVNTEVVSGTGATILYAAYSDIYNVSVTDLDLATPIALKSSTTSTNQILSATPTSTSHDYQLTYAINKSFYLDNQYIDNGTPTGRIFFDKAPSSYGMTTYRIDYESSKYDPATPVDMPLNNLHTSLDEGFVYIDHDTHNFNQLEVRISPSKITADAVDYALVTFRAYDTNGNPKPNQSLNLFTNFGTLSKSSVVTDRDGFAFATLTSELWDGSLSPSPATPALKAATPGTDDEGIILADGAGAVDAKVGFKIQIPPPAQYRIIAVMDSDFILADGNSATNIFGLVEDSNHTPVPYAVVYWRKARTEYEAFQKVAYNSSTATPGSSNISGYVVADSKGRFTVGPFVSSIYAGYWLTVLETGSASPNLNRNQFDIVGDMVYWYEHPDITNMIDPITQMPISNVQDATPYWNIPSYAGKTTLPVTYDEDDIQAGYSGSATPTWLPPKWWAIDRYTQYLIGLDGTAYDTFRATPSYPDYKDF